jgi:TRAP-type C4-dicarboxylate transport system permease small subunit
VSEGAPAKEPFGLRVINGIASVLIAAAVLLMAVQVVLRFGFSRPQPWAEELNRYAFVWAAYLGTIIALARGTHIRVTVLIDRMGPRWLRRSTVLDRLVCLVCFAYVAWFGFVNAWDNRSQSFFTIPEVPQLFFSLSVPIAMAIMVFYLLFSPRRRAKD